MQRTVYLGIIIFLLVISSLAQPSRRRLLPNNSQKQTSRLPGEFTFVRVIYHSNFSGRGFGSWAVDYPEADYHLIQGIRDWAGTNLDISAEPKQLEILDEQLFSHPLIYFV